MICLKYIGLLRIIFAATLALCCLFACAALAEDELYLTEMELFTAGDFPEPPPIRTYALDRFDSYLYEQLMLGNPKIDISAYQIPKDELALTLTYAINDHPDLFFVGPSISIYMGTEYVSHYVPQYLFTGDDLKVRQAAFNASVEAIAADARIASTTIGRLLRVNDYFCTHYSYDQSLSIFRPDLLFSGGTGVCQAYMLGYAAVLDELGIPNTHATSVSMNHTWNLVNVGEDWYHIDVTWNDPTPDKALQARHRYFMLSDDGMLAAKHSNWASSVPANGTAYDSAFWQPIYTPLAVVEDSVYYMSSTAPNGVRSIMHWDSTSGASSEICKFSIVDSNNSYSLTGAYGPISADSDYIYYGARGVLWAAGRSGENPFPVYFTQGDSIHIWSCYSDGNTISMRVGESNETMSVVSCPASQRMPAAFNPSMLEMYPGESAQAAFSFDMVLPKNTSLALLSSDESILTVDASGTAVASAPGVAYISIAGNTDAENICPVIVHSENALVLPENTIELKAESFTGVSAIEVVLPNGLKSIGADAFRDCRDLRIVHMPDSLQSTDSIDASAFPVDTPLTLICSEGSAGAAFAEAQGIRCLVLPVSTE